MGIVMSVCLPVKRVSGTENSLTSSGMLFQVSSFILDICNTLLFPDAFSKEAVFPTCSPCSDFAVILVASLLEGAFIDPIANSILGATILLRAVENAFWILSPTISTKLLNSLSIVALKYLSKVFTFTVFPLVTKLLPEVPTVKSRSLVLSLTLTFSRRSVAALPIITS